ncbi:MAG: membrane bound O-acyl transferase family-domain-containing protein, partial [Acidobacteriota bacterium]
MNAYLPDSLSIICYLITFLVTTLLLGFLITRLPSLSLARVSAWLLALLAVIGVERLCKEEPAGLRMLAIIGVLFYSMKAVVTVEAQAAGKDRLKPLQWFGFAAGWFGMRPYIFSSLGKPPVAQAASLLWLGIKRLGLGLLLILLAWLLFSSFNTILNDGFVRLVVTLLLLIGLSLMLHFGILNIFAATWRYFGVNCNQLFIAPLMSTSLSEFWGRRWNMAFSEMTSISVYRPLIPLLGKQVAAVIAFLFSGLLHELAISVPVKLGFGLPLAYFMLHGILVIIERKLEQLGWPIYRIKWLGRTWTIFWLTLPMPILFHKYF